MRVSFRSSKLEKKCLKGKIFKNQDINQELTERFIDLQDAETLLDIKKIKYLRLHPLKGSRRYSLAIDVVGRRNPNRIIFETCNGENVYDDWMNDKKFETVTHIEIIEIGDYH